MFREASLLPRFRSSYRLSFGCRKSATGVGVGNTIRSPSVKAQVLHEMHLPSEEAVT